MYEYVRILVCVLRTYVRTCMLVDAQAGLALALSRALVAPWFGSTLVSVGTYGHCTKWYRLAHAIAAHQQIGSERWLPRPSVPASGPAWSVLRPCPFSTWPSVVHLVSRQETDIAAALLPRVIRSCTPYCTFNTVLDG